MGAVSRSPWQHTWCRSRRVSAGEKILTAMSGLSARTYSWGGEVSRSGEGEREGGSGILRLRPFAAGAAAPEVSFPPLSVNVFLTTGTGWIDSSSLDGSEERELSESMSD